MEAGDSHSETTAISQQRLVEASRDGDIPTIRYLLGCGVDPSVNDNQALCEAARIGWVDVIRLLISMGADPSVAR